MLSLCFESAGSPERCAAQRSSGAVATVGSMKVCAALGSSPGCFRAFATVGFLGGSCPMRPRDVLVQLIQ